MSRFSFTPPKLVGHAVAMLAGAGLAFVGFHSAETSVSETEGAGDKVANSAQKEATKHASMAGDARPSQSGNRAAAFRQAWAQLLKSKLSPNEKRTLQKRLLAEWADVDLDGALAAAAVLAPGDDGAFSSNFSYFDAFHGKMAKNPELFWPAIRDNRFGLATGQLRNSWMRTVAQANPQLLLSYIGELTPAAREKSLGLCLGALGKNPELKKQMLVQFAGLPDNPDNRGLWQTAGRALAGEHPEDLAAQLADSASEGERRMLLAGLANQLTKLKDSEAIRSSFELVPEAMKKDAALAILGQGSSTSATCVTADYFVEKQDWDALQKNVPMKIHQLSLQSGNAEALAQWGAHLPERTETENLYRCSVRGRIMQQPEQAKDWIMTLPAGWKRDNALTEYVNNSLHFRRDEQAAAWAIERIDGAHFKETATTLQNRWRQQKKP